MHEEGEVGGGTRVESAHCEIWRLEDSVEVDRGLNTPSMDYGRVLKKARTAGQHT